MSSSDVRQLNCYKVKIDRSWKRKEHPDQTLIQNGDKPVNVAATLDR